MVPSWVSRTFYKVNSHSLLIFFLVANQSTILELKQIPPLREYIWPAPQKNHWVLKARLQNRGQETAQCYIILRIWVQTLSIHRRAGYGRMETYRPWESWGVRQSVTPDTLPFLSVSMWAPAHSHAWNRHTHTYTSVCRIHHTCSRDTGLSH